MSLAGPSKTIVVEPIIVPAKRDVPVPPPPPKVPAGA
jgi:hypothetical protein